MSTEDLIAGARPPIVAIVGHIDHGKSTLLDYIRTANVVEGEAGGITQHLSAYEAEHKNSTGVHRITFLDTPGHEAFRGMRSRGLEIADVAILVVSAEEGVKPQTLEALKLIEGVKIPYIVAFTKIDKPNANLEKAKMSLLEHNIYLEGLGGDVPFVAVSGKTGEGIPELLDLILLAGELEGLSADPEAVAEGVVIEAHVDPKRGNTATLIVQNGSIENGEYVVSGSSFAPVRIMENFAGKKIKKALPGQPVMIIGFSQLPSAGASWKIVESKKEAEEDVSLAQAEFRKANLPPPIKALEELAEGEEEKLHIVLPIVIKTDVAGTAEAVMHEIEKLPQDPRLEIKIVGRSVGSISENDVKLVAGSLTPGIIIGFNVKVEREAKDLAQRQGVEVEVFTIIYKLTEWLSLEIEKRRPRERVEESLGSAKILKVFSAQKNRVVLGGRVEEGTLKQSVQIKILRREVEVGRGSVVSLQTQKREVKEIEAGQEFGAMIKVTGDAAAGDVLIAFETVLK